MPTQYTRRRRLLYARCRPTCPLRGSSCARCSREYIAPAEHAVRSEEVLLAVLLAEFGQIHVGRELPVSHEADQRAGLDALHPVLNTLVNVGNLEQHALDRVTATLEQQEARLDAQIRQQRDELQVVLSGRHRELEFAVTALRRTDDARLGAIETQLDRLALVLEAQRQNFNGILLVDEATIEELREFGSSLAGLVAQTGTNLETTIETVVETNLARHNNGPMAEFAADLKSVLAAHLQRFGSEQHKQLMLSAQDHTTLLTAGLNAQREHFTKTADEQRALLRRFLGNQVAPLAGQTTPAVVTSTPVGRVKDEDLVTSDDEAGDMQPPAPRPESVSSSDASSIVSQDDGLLAALYDDIPAAPYKSTMPPVYTPSAADGSAVHAAFALGFTRRLRAPPPSDDEADADVDFEDA
ncbi:hypothetical protein DFJ74DRAFT_747442 [Hyaloraphidium curvatum]|nr:hypothetical protein DFJ74DRAFT_747442 [Hyaloraphidium curvatum]